MSGILRSTFGMVPEVAAKRIEAFRERFGETHLYFAYHAAFPLALTPDLLYHLWANFQRDIHGEMLNIPWIAVSDLLLSSLCEEVGHELYEMNVAVRNDLLNQLKSDSRFGVDRINELSDFLLTHIQQQLDSYNSATREFAQAQRWICLSHTRSNILAREIASTFAELKLEEKTEWIRITSLVETFAESLSGFEPLLIYSRGMWNLGQGNVDRATAEFCKLASQNYQVNIAGLDLAIPNVVKLQEAQTNQTIASSKFTKRNRIIPQAIDLFFNDSIDWKAFLASLQDLQAQYGDELSICDIGRRAGGTFLVRLEVPLDTDKGTIERQVKELYETKLQTLEIYHQDQIEIERARNTQLMRIIELMAQETPKYELRGAKFGGGFAADGGTQADTTFNDFSQNINEIGKLIQALRSQAEAFPEGMQQETVDYIADLETDIQQFPEKRKSSRIKAALLALTGMATVVSDAVVGASEFATNVQELSEKLGIPLLLEQVQPQQSDAVYMGGSDQE